MTPRRPARHRRPVSRWWLVLGVTMVATVLPAAASQVEPLHAAEGEWVGHVSFRGTTAQLSAPFRGSFEFSSAGGEVNGSFQWGSGTTTIAGVVSGPDTMPRFDLTRVTSNGVDIPDVSGGGEIEFTAATCERLEGTGVNIGVERMGAADISEIVWWAIRGESASDPAAFFDALEALRLDVSGIIADIEAGYVLIGGIRGQLEPALADAERLAGQLDRSEGCGIEFYRSVIAAEVGRLLDFVLSDPDTAALHIGWVFLTAVRAGVIDTYDGGPESEREVAAYEYLAERIEDASEAGDTVALDLLAVIAYDMGWYDLNHEALAALEEIR